MEILYEDNHLIIVNKAVGEIVQGDKTGDRTLADEVKAYIKATCAKSGEVYLGIPHRLDRPVSGVCVFARTSKALERLNRMFREGEVRKVYHAIVCGVPKESTALLTHYLSRNEKQNKAYAYKEERPGTKRATLDYRTLSVGERYALLEVNLHTGRHHQIRCQLADVGCPVKGDLKYGAPRSNPDAGISLHARRIAFDHPVRHVPVEVVAPYPARDIWHVFAE